MTTFSVIGIDLGTTYSCVGCMKNGQIEIVPNDQGQRLTPSIVAYKANSKEILVGDLATTTTTSRQNTENDIIIYNSKRIIGKVFGDSTIDNNFLKGTSSSSVLPFEIIQNPQTCGKSGEAVFKISNNHIFNYEKDNNNNNNNSCCKKNKTIKKNWTSPQEVAAEILKSLKRSAEQYLGGVSVCHAVITVPAYFNNEQRKATRQAGELAGLNVLQLLNEPTAAALEYGRNTTELPQYEQHDNNNNTKVKPDEKEEKTILVADLGGGTYDVSILKLKNNNYTVKAVDGDNSLGGEDFTNRLVNHFLTEFTAATTKKPKKYKSKKSLLLENNARIIRKLRNACEQSKRILSFEEKSFVHIDNLLDETQDFSSSITRETFQQICYDLFQRLLPPISKVLEISKTARSDIDEIVLVGGATRMPRVREILKEYFSRDKDIPETVNPDESVAVGATIMAIKLAQERIKQLGKNNVLMNLELENSTSFLSSPKYAIPPECNFVLKEVVPMTIRLACKYGVSEVMIPRGTPIPTSRTRGAYVLTSNSAEFETEVLEGESPLVEKNNILGRFKMTNLSQRRSIEMAAGITMSIDLDGILKVSGYELAKSSRNGLPSYHSSKQEIVIENVTNSLTTENRLRMIQSSETDRMKDEIECRRRLCRRQLYKAVENVELDCRILLANNNNNNNKTQKNSNNKQDKLINKQDKLINKRQKEILKQLNRTKCWVEKKGSETREKYLEQERIVRELGKEFKSLIRKEVEIEKEGGVEKEKDIKYLV